VLVFHCCKKTPEINNLRADLFSFIVSVQSHVAPEVRQDIMATGAGCSPHGGQETENEEEQDSRDKLYLFGACPQ
jgi:hypothetical protein